MKRIFTRSLLVCAMLAPMTVLATTDLVHAPEALYLSTIPTWRFPISSPNGFSVAVSAVVKWNDPTAGKGLCQITGMEGLKVKEFSVSAGGEAIVSFNGYVPYPVNQISLYCKKGGYYAYSVIASMTATSVDRVFRAK